MKEDDRSKRWKHLLESNCLDERIKQISSFNFLFITEAYMVGQIKELKQAVNKLKSDCDIYLYWLDSNSDVLNDD